MKQTLFALAIPLLLYGSAANSQCASVPPTTGLGDCIDLVTAASAQLTEQISTLGYVIQYGPSSHTDYVNQDIYIQSYNCDSWNIDDLYFTVAALAHELGHAERGIVQDTSSRTAYITSWCDNEGYAVINNIKGREEILACSSGGSDIGLAASNQSQLLTTYNAGGPDVLTNVGKAFCDNNVASTTGQTYNDFYGDHYDVYFP